MDPVSRANPAFPQANDSDSSPSSVLRGNGLALKLREAPGLFFTEDQSDLHQLLISGSGFFNMSSDSAANPGNLPSNMVSDPHGLQFSPHLRLPYLNFNLSDDAQVEILLCGGRGQKLDPFKISPLTLEEIQKTRDIPDQLFEQFQPKLGYFTTTKFMEREILDEEQASEHALRYVNIAIGDFGYSEQFYCVFFRHDILRRKAFCLCICGGERISVQHITKLCKNLHTDILANPMTFLWMLIKEQSWELGLKQRGSHGFQSYYEFSGNLGISHYAQTLADYGGLTRKVYNESQFMIELSASFETSIRLCGVLSNLNDAVGSAYRNQKGLSPRKISELSIAGLLLSERLQVLKYDLEDHVSQYKSYAAILQSQFSLLYSLIGQRDNRLNFFLAKATRRDGMSMKTIAVVSLLFLPTTFVSAIFSASPMNFDGVQKIWWVYLLLCLVLTILAVLSWTFYMWSWSNYGGRSQDIDLQIERDLRGSRDSESSIFSVTSRGPNLSEVLQLRARAARYRVDT